MKIRKYNKKDMLEIYKLFYNTVHYINCRHYNKDQLNVWAKPIEDIDLESWAGKFSESSTLVIELNNRIVAFSNIDNNGNLDMFYVHKDFQGIGLGRELLKNIYKYAKDSGFEKITASISITAKPLFLKYGYKLLEEASLTIDGVSIKGYNVEKYIE